MWHHFRVAVQSVRAALHRWMGRRRRQPGVRPGEPEGLEASRPLGILVVDDEPAIRTLLVAALPHYGFRVFPAADGAEAIALYRRHQTEIAVVLLDVQLPGLDGPQTLSVLRAINPHIRCSFMTGDPGDYTEEELLNRGAARVLRKPFRLPEVIKAVYQLVSARS